MAPSSTSVASSAESKSSGWASGAGLPHASYVAAERHEPQARIEATLRADVGQQRGPGHQLERGVQHERVGRLEPGPNQRVAHVRDELGIGEPVEPVPEVLVVGRFPSCLHHRRHTAVRYDFKFT